MTQSFRKTLGGYDPNAGRSAHAADKPTLIPVPSLLRSLLTEHLDPGYAAAAEARAAGEAAGRRRPRWQNWAWQLCGVLLIAVVFATAVAQARSTATGVRETQHALAGSVRSAEAATTDLAARRDALAAQVDTERRSRLEGGERGQELLGQLDQADFAAAATAVIGPGLTITVTDPGVSQNLSDVSKERVAGSRQVILDRDLQLVVNSLWAAGAEAVSVGGVRVGPNVTVRQAGGGILVDNQPIASPYVILAIGPPNALKDIFERSPGLQRLRLLEISYGVGVQVSASDTVTLPAGSVREVNFAKQIGR
ncbi:DUF881 domain-containing protein [Mycolicibacterium elephantis]|uniref:DUF881 domain-containing protein n=1 Tax=Mycolicibacterium elephantis TaxID=81858 RepID=A0A0M2ZJS0_9MYCO|nr:DUF881 domain-containing protein [Mycolicibacterium elephantis]KKW64435.1 hypothetical protein AAV95_12020 [Mycolicibacterium elephantis]OBA78215.1 hypothetical protein A5633_17805 [Mycolicibacterium elephantis]OBB19220.1 hypothetical protein A5762_17425 [Mycolicibacterium elephantis]OBE92827.1 hypothetical protein A5776_04705 [Mycolicibacterium elephantis]ORA65476.1 hypothetical protein BST23_13980 [Mycolicibacterium elephantis]